jgi:lipid II:glycine glycyltransferase (peptidoglycan interpeptide bridge formation enzyme)
MTNQNQDSIRIIESNDKNIFDRLASHPLQSWAWGEFRKQMGVNIVRLGKYKNEELIEVVQLSLHRLPLTSFTIGYIPKSLIPSKEMMQKLIEVGKEYKCIFIKLEPNVELNKLDFQFPYNKLPIIKSPHPLFTKYTFKLNLKPDEEELLKCMHPKTRYNIRIAQKHQVKVQEDNSKQAFEKYLTLTFETTKRQKFYAHDKKYHEKMWETLSKANIAHLFTANYYIDNKPEVLAAWIVFHFNNILYYPYGSSSSRMRNIMASNLMMWETILYGRKMGAIAYDMWGSLGPNPNPKDPWYGFHRFKEGYGARLIEFIGSFDLIINPFYYRLYNIFYCLRSLYLKIKSHIS